MNKSFKEKLASKIVQFKYYITLLEIICANIACEN